MNKLFYLLLLLIFASCNTTRKSSSSTTSNIDSTVIRDKDAFIAELEKELSKKKTDSFTQIITDVQFEKCDSVPATVVFDNGKLSSVTGQIKYIKQDNTAILTQIEEVKKERDSIAVELNSEKVKVERLEKEKLSYVKRTVTPIWVWFLIALLSVPLLRAYFPRIIDFFKPKI